MQRFKAAMALAGSEFMEALTYAAKASHAASARAGQIEKMLKPRHPAPLLTCPCMGNCVVAPHARWRPRWCVLGVSQLYYIAGHAPERRALPPLLPWLQSWLPARSHVKEALEQRQQVHPSGARYLLPIAFRAQPGGGVERSMVQEQQPHPTAASFPLPNHSRSLPWPMPCRPHHQAQHLLPL